MARLAPLDANQPTPEPASPPLQPRDLADSFHLAEGFRIEKIADDQLVHNAYCLAAREDGVLAVAGPGYVRLLADSNGDGWMELESDLAHAPRDGAQGLFFDGDALLAVGGGGLLRYSDLHAGEPPRRLLELKTGGEHHAHAVRRGPDGALYLMCGNMTFDEPIAGLSPGSPVAEPRAGVLLRFDLSGDQKEVRNLAVVADGMRNAYDFDFLRSGDPVTFDSDDEREISFPWYRPTRVFRLLPGSDAGWFSRSWKWPEFVPAMPETMAELGRGSPTGVLVLRDGNWPAPLDNAILVCDWTFGRLVAIPLNERDEPGEPISLVTASGDLGFAPTDLELLRDGSLVIVTGGRGTTGQLLRLRPVALETDGSGRSPADDAFVFKQALKKEPSPARLFDALSSEDALKHQMALGVLADQMREGSFSLLDHPRLGARVVASLSHPSANLRKAALRVVGALSADEQAEFEKLLPEGVNAARIRFELGKNRNARTAQVALVGLGLDFLEAQTEFREDSRQDYLDAVWLAQLGLGGAGGPGDQTETLASYLPRAADVDPAGPSRVDENRRLGDRIVAMLPVGIPEVDDELVRLLAMLRTHDPAHRAALIARITRDSHPTADLHHLLAIAALRGAGPQEQVERVAAALLAIDPKLDSRNLRRDQYWTMRLQDLARTFQESAPTFFARLVNSPQFGDPAHAALLAEAAVGQRATASEVYRKQAERDGLEDWTPELLTFVVTADPLQSRGLLRAALDVPVLREAAWRGIALAPSPTDRPDLIQGLESLDVETVTLCLKALGQLGLPHNDAEIAALGRAVGRFDRNRLEYQLRDALVARLAALTGETFGFVRGEEGYQPQREVVGRWVNHAHALEPPTNLAGEDWDVIVARLASADRLAGDSRRGAVLYEKLACGRCHEGGVVGPDLAGITGRFSRHDLFRAIVEPDRDIPARYRGVLVQTTAGKIVTGLVAYESSDGVLLKDGTHTWRIEAEDIELRQALTTSLMPRGLLRDLTEQDLADLWVYLGTL